MRIDMKWGIPCAAYRKAHTGRLPGVCRSKRPLVLAAVLCVGMILSGCSLHRGVDTQRSNPGGSGGNRLQVVATIFPYYDFARQVAGEYADVSLVVPAGMDTHSFEPTASDMITIGKADILLYNGGEMEQWVEQVIEAAENPKLLADEMMRHVETFEEESVEGMEPEAGHHHEEHGDEESEDPDHEEHGEEEVENSGHEEHGEEETADAGHEEHDGHEGEIDEHIWTSPVNACKLVEQIAEDLSEADPEHQTEYQKNAENYIYQIQKVDEQIRKVVSEADSHYLVFGDRFPLRYFVEEYGLAYSAAFNGCSADTEPSAETIAYLTDKVKEENVPVVLKIELTSDRVANVIAETAGAEVETFYTCHNVTRTQLEEGVTYVSLMQENVKVLMKALTKTSK